jgi:type IV pilus assembly protein PilW
MKSRTHRQGFTIVELMVAMTVGLVIVAALFAVVTGSSATSKSRDRDAVLQSDGRYAMDQMRTDILHAGFLGISSLFFPDQPLSSSGIVVGNACDAANAGQLSLRIWGTNDSNPFAATCIPAANYAGGDVLVIRALNPTPVTAPFVASQVYYHSAYEGGQPFVGPTPPDFSGSSKMPPYIDYRIEETVYYVSPYTSSPTESPLVPALYRLKLGNGPTMVPELVATGVESLQLRFGLYQTNDTMRYLTANQVSSTIEWDLIKAVQVWLLMRSTSGEPGYVNATTYTMGDQNITVNDGFRRALLNSVVQFRN